MRLTEKDIAIIDGIKAGKPLSEIAEALNISYATIADYMRRRLVVLSGKSLRDNFINLETTQGENKNGK